jgi:type III pantothenate kinase
VADPIAGFDVGNSSVKFGRFRGDGVETVRGARCQSSETIEEFVDAALSDRRFDDAVVATVNPPVSDRLRQALESRGIRVRRVYASDGSLFDENRIGCDVDTPKSTGVDRVLACIAALRRHPGRDVIVATCGTAVTVNLATADGVFRGGAILPGLELMARSLHEGTAALPMVACPAPPELRPADEGPFPAVPARSTISAMRAGVLYAAVGAVDRLVAEIRKGRPDAVAVITGGDADVLCSALACRPHYSPHLVLEGLARVVGESAP